VYEYVQIEICQFAGSSYLFYECAYKKIGDVQLSRRFTSSEVKLGISFDFKPQ